MLVWSYLTFLLKIWNGRVNGILIEMPNDTKYAGLQRVQIQTVRRRKIDPDIIKI